MGKVKFDNVDDDVYDAELSGGFYDGPIPPARQVYRTIVKRMELTKTGPSSKNPGSPMLKLLLEFSAKKGNKDSQYDGYGVWHNLNVTKQGAGFVNQFLDAIAQGNEEKSAKLRKAFWGGSLVVEDDGEGHVVRIGPLKVNSPNGDIVVFIGTKMDSYKGQERLVASRFLWPDESDADDDEEESDAVVEDLPEDLADAEPAEEASDDDDDSDDDSDLF